MLGSAGLFSDTLAAALDRSVDCVKLLIPNGTVEWMNRNGLCAMEISDFDDVSRILSRAPDTRWIS